MLAQQRNRGESIPRDPVSATDKRTRQICLDILRFCGLLLACFGITTRNVTASEGRFRVETTVYDGQRVVDRRTTLFRDDLVVDFSAHATEIVTLLDLAARTLILVDDANQVISRISVDQMAQFVAEQQLRIRRMPPKLRQVLVPELVRSWDPQQQTLILGSPELDYTATLVEPKSPGIVRAYRTYTDWMARFNAIQPGGRPPASRLKLNREISDLGLVPSEIRKTVNTGVVRTQRTNHQYHLGWRPQDRKRADQVWNSQRKYGESEFFEFLRRLDASSSGR